MSQIVRHNDLAWNLIRNTDGVLDRIDLEKDMCDQYWFPNSDCQTDIPRLTEGMVGGQVRCMTVGRCTQINGLNGRRVGKLCQQTDVPRL